MCQWKISTIAVASVDFDDRRDQRNEVVADVLDVRALVDGEAIGELHQRSRRARFGRVDRSGDVVDGRRVCDTSRAASASFMLIDPRIGQLGEIRLVGVEVRHQRFRSDRDRDHLAPSSVVPIEQTRTRGRRLGEQAHVGIDLFRVRKIVRARRRCRRAPLWESGRSMMRAGNRPAVTERTAPWCTRGSSSCTPRRSADSDRGPVASRSAVA